VHFVKTSSGHVRCLHYRAQASGNDSHAQDDGNAGENPTCKHRTPVCFLPGAAGRAEHGETVAAVATSFGRDCLTLDWPGSGESTDAHPCCSTAALSALVWEIVQFFDWPRVILVGHSLGAMVVTHMAEDDRAERAILVAATPGLHPCLRLGIIPFPLRSIVVLVFCALTLCRLSAAASQSDLNLAWLKHGLEHHTMPKTELKKAVNAFSPKPSCPSGVKVWCRRRLGDVAALIAILRHAMPSCAVSSRSRCPAVIIHGDKDRLIIPEAGRLAAALWPTSNYEEINCGGHFLHWESRDALLSALE